MTLCAPVDRLGAILKSVSEKTQSYWWKVSGEDPNSLSLLLGITAEQMEAIWVACGLRISKTNKFSRVQLDYLTLVADTEWVFENLYTKNLSTTVYTSLHT